MSIEIKDMEHGTGNIITGSGIITREEFNDAYRKHLKQDGEKLKKYKYSLSIYTEVVQVGITSNDIENLSWLCQEASAYNQHVVLAMVTDKNLIFGLSRMLEMLLSPTDWETMVFKKRDEAENWLKKRVKEKFGIEDITFE